MNKGRFSWADSHCRGETTLIVLDCISPQWGPNRKRKRRGCRNASFGIRASSLYDDLESLN